MTDLDHAADELRAVLAARAADMPPKDLHDAVVRRARRHRVTVLAVTATAVALVAAGVPTALAAVRSDAAPKPPATRPVPELYGCAGGQEPGTQTGAPWDDPRIPAQRDVVGSLGGDPAAVRAVAQAGYGAMTATKPDVDPSRVRVVAAHQAEDGWVVGAVTGSDRNRGIFLTARVIGPDLGHLTGLTDGWTEGRGLTKRFGSSDVLVDVIRHCGPVRALVVGSPGAQVEIDWMTGITADAKVERGTQPVAVRPDGLAVATLSAPSTTIAAVRLTGTPAGASYVGPDVPSGPSRGEMGRKLLTAPGNLANRKAWIGLVDQVHLRLPVRQRDARVLWAGQGAGDAIATAAVSTLPSGAQLLWGCTVTWDNGQSGVSPYTGLLPAGSLDRTAYVVRPEPGLVPPGTKSFQAVFFTGTHRVDITTGGRTRTESITGGTIVGPDATVVVHAADGTPMPLVDVKSGLTKPDQPGP